MLRPKQSSAPAKTRPLAPSEGEPLVRVPAEHAAIGMFVAEIDRPWLETPFPMQGFLLEDAEQLRVLTSTCKRIDVDLKLSTPTAVTETITFVKRGIATPVARVDEARIAAAERQLEEIAQAEARAGGRKHGTSRTGRTSIKLPKARADIQVDTRTRRRFETLVQELDRHVLQDPRATARDRPAAEPRSGPWLRLPSGWLTRLFGLRGLWSRRSLSRVDASREAIRAELPKGIEFRQYARRHSVRTELPRAQATVTRSRQVLRQLVSDITGGRAPDVASVNSVVGDMVASMIDNPDAMFWVGRLREEQIDAYNHSIKVAIHLIALGRHLGFPPAELSQLGLVGMLADIGKVKLARDVLDKPSVLTGAEFEHVKQHVRFSLELLREAGPLPVAVELGIAQHHERMDGSGYPAGLSGHDISLYGRMAAIADRFSALTTIRTYANALSPQEALIGLFDDAGKGLHEALVEQFVQAVCVFPVGSLVELGSGEVAIVVAHNHVRRLEPRVLVLTAPDKSPLPQPRDLDLLAQRRGGGPRLRIARGLPVGAFGLKARDYYAPGAHHAAARAARAEPVAA